MKRSTHRVRWGQQRVVRWRDRGFGAWTGYAAAAVMVAVITLLGGVIFGRREPADVVMLYLLGIVLISMRFGFGPSIMEAVLSVLAFDFFFIPPYLTFAVANLRHIGTFGIMLLVAVVISSLTERVRAQTDAARDREKRTATLYAMSRELIHTIGQEALTDAAVRHLGEVLGSRAVLFTPDQAGGLIPVRGQDGDASAPHPEPDGVEAGIVSWVWAHEREAGLNMNTWPDAAGLFVPLIGSQGKVGVLGVFPGDRARLEDPEQRRLLDAFVTQIAMALERTQLVEERQRAYLRAEQEQIRSTLLSSVSHDFRTPLAAVTGAASTLLEDDAVLDAPTRRELLQTISEEAERLNRLVRNLLDMTRLESGAVSIHKEWQPIEEVVGAALQRMDRHLRGRDVRVDLPDDLPLVPLDAALLEQVLVNLVENALKYTPEGSPVEIRARESEAEVVVEVADRGPGIPDGEGDRIFEKLYRVTRDHAPGGVGLGLAICRAIVKTHGGRIWAENRPGGGASFRFALPVEGRPPELRAETLPEDVG